MKKTPDFLPSRSTTEWQELDSAVFLHPFTKHGEIRKAGARIIDRAEDIYVYTNDGDKLLDSMSGLWCCNLGYSTPEISAAINQQLEYLPFYNNFFQCAHTTAIETARRLVEIAPPHISNVFFAGSGSEANDTNIRLVRRYWDIQGKTTKRYFIARENAYHGSSIASASLGGMAFMHDQFDTLPYVEHVMQPYQFGEGLPGESEEEFGRRAARSVEEKILELGAENVAAMIGEPIMGAGGVRIPPPNYWTLVADICKQYDVLLIADEVITGFGRTGHWFASEYYNIQPDLITFAKAVTNGYQQLGGVLVSDKVAKVLLADEAEFAHGYTFNGHPAACAAALKTIELFQRDNILARVRDDIGPWFKQRFLTLGAHPLVGEARVLGMLGAIEIVMDKATRQRFPKGINAGNIVRDAVTRHGLVMRAVGDTMISAPPLIISRAQVDELVEKALKGLDEAGKILAQMLEQ
ncbi:aminotransferase class III-fold pyridoxal phosphate-dependent enzyme [Pseudomaricurvus alcaniphilus]|uniref:aminotransferase n=1 Tax=Pseudomaricurvus alcaniphilus TaxID=1166482 RepID=UPI00140B8BCC|nr:aminotransferase [Pseudomaricurvus alcaniphilus]NHN38364.1 aminotransferase class III-fold pyridoxal phosphate-dependent enzyme [Pseudomaricurvus alcaniphilus]